MKYLLIMLFSVLAFGQAPNEMVSFTQAQSLGFLLNPGQSHVTSNRCMTKQEAITKYSLNPALLNAYASNQLIPRSAWPDCSVKISPTTYKRFMCHNLGADPQLDSNVPVQALMGNYYQWGRNIPVADSYTSAAPIAGWNATPAPADAWSDASKTATDPCPPGSRVPTTAQFEAIVANNVYSSTGTFVDSPTNFGSAIHFGPNAATKVLTFPINGGRSGTNGALIGRGSQGAYWTSSLPSSGSATNRNIVLMLPSISSVGTNVSDSATWGYSIRCISE